MFFIMSKASKLISGAIIGSDYKIAVVNGKSYKIFPPTIKKMAGAGQHLSGLKDGETIKDILDNVNDIDKLAHALSWMVDGSDFLSDEFEKAEMGEVVDALAMAYSLISVENFTKLSVLARNVSRLIANPKL